MTAGGAVRLSDGMRRIMIGSATTTAAGTLGSRRDEHTRRNEVSNIFHKRPTNPTENLALTPAERFAFGTPTQEELSKVGRAVLQSWREVSRKQEELVTEAAQAHGEACFEFGSNSTQGIERRWTLSNALATRRLARDTWRENLAAQENAAEEAWKSARVNLAEKAEQFDALYEAGKFLRENQF